MNDKDAEDMHRLALGGSSAVSGDASEPSEWRLRDEGQPQYLEGCRAQFSIERGKPYPFSDTIAYVFDEADAKQIMQALASQASPAKRGAEPSDEQISLRPYIYGREAGANEKVWTEAAVLETARQAVREALAQSAPSGKLAGAETFEKALRRAFQLGQTYWQQADSESASQWRKSDATRAKFEELVASHAQTVPQVPDMRAICEALGFDPTNHHNAAKCPYCRPADASLQPEAAGAAQAPAGQDAEQVMALLETGEWKLTKMLPAAYLTDEANQKMAWLVERQIPPFCTQTGPRYWNGPTAIEALRTAMKDLGIDAARKAQEGKA